MSALANDPSVNEALRNRPEWVGVIDRQMALLADVDPGPAGTVKAAMVFSGIAGAGSVAAEGTSDEDLSGYLIDARAPHTRPTRC